MSPEPSGPVDPIPVIRATRARDFRMPTDRGVAMSPEFDPIGGFERPLTVAWVPVFLTDPPRRFVRMTAIAYSTDSCHLVHRKVATQSTRTLPPNPQDCCHPVH